MCIQLSKFPDIDQQIVEVVGLFVNGTIHGNIKLTMEDGTVIITNFDNGIPKGIINI